ncbi:MAG: hypothetical protein AAF443_05775 [Chlamydiota bacterium]
MKTKFSWLFLHNGKRVKIVSTVFFSIILFTPIFLYNSAAKSRDKTSTDIFLENLMIREGGLYTLLGSKPITEFSINDNCPTPPQTEGEFKQGYKILLNSLSTEGASSIPSYRIYKKSLKNLGKLEHLNTRALWEAWEKSGKKVLNRKYKLLSFNVTRSEKIGLFINVANLECIMYLHYTIFKKQIGYDFLVDEVIKEFDSGQSSFWESVFSNHLLSGLVFGFGYEDSYLFSWIEQNNIEIKNKARRTSSGEICGFSLKNCCEILTKNPVSVHDLIVPIFSVMSAYSSEAEKYKKEREQILKLLKGKNLTSFVIDYLQASE